MIQRKKMHLISLVGSDVLIPLFNVYLLGLRKDNRFWFPESMGPIAIRSDCYASSTWME